MSTIVTKATRGAVAGNGWTSPASAAADDSTYATAAPAKNGHVTGDWDFAAFSDAELPVGAAIDSVTLRVQYKASTTASNFDITLTRKNGGASDGTTNDASEPAVDTNLDSAFAALPTESDLKTAGQISVTADAHRGSSNTAVTASIDYIELRVAFHLATVVTPDPAALTSATFAPASTVTTNIQIVPDVASLASATFAPVAIAPRVVTPGVANLTTAGLAPTAQAPRVAVPAPVVLTTACLAPDVEISGPSGLTLTPGTAALAATSFSPSTLVPRQSTPGTTGLAISTFGPVVGTPRAVVVGLAHLSLIGLAPAIVRPILAVPGVRAAVLTMFAPVGLASERQRVTPDAAALALVSFAPSTSSAGPIVGGRAPRFIPSSGAARASAIHRTPAAAAVHAKPR